MNKSKIINLLKDKLEQISNLKNSTTSSSAFKDWHASTRVIFRRLGENYLQDFDNISYSPGIVVGGSGDWPFIRACNSGLDSASSLIKSTIEELELFDSESTSKIGNTISNADNSDKDAKQNLRINISLTQQQSQTILQSLDLSKYDDETQDKVDELFKELQKKKKNKELIKNIFKWLADKAVDVLISIALQSAQ